MQFIPGEELAIDRKARVRIPSIEQGARAASERTRYDCLEPQPIAPVGPAPGRRGPPLPIHRTGTRTPAGWHPKR